MSTEPKTRAPIWYHLLRWSRVALAFGLLYLVFAIDPHPIAAQLGSNLFLVLAALTGTLVLDGFSQINGFTDHHYGGQSLKAYVSDWLGTCATALLAWITLGSLALLATGWWLPRWQSAIWLAAALVIVVALAWRGYLKRQRARELAKAKA
jgi:hypothetical protein